MTPAPATFKAPSRGAAGRLPVTLVTGFLGSGKTTVGSLLAGRLGWPYAEADAFHSEANVAKMAAGHPLTDDDRWPWLAAIAAWVDARIARRRLLDGLGHRRHVPRGRHLRGDLQRRVRRPDRGGEDALGDHHGGARALAADVEAAEIGLGAGELHGRSEPGVHRRLGEIAVDAGALVPSAAGAETVPEWDEPWRSSSV